MFSPELKEESCLAFARTLAAGWHTRREGRRHGQTANGKVPPSLEERGGGIKSFFFFSLRLIRILGYLVTKEPGQFCWPKYLRSRERSSEETSVLKHDSVDL